MLPVRDVVATGRPSRQIQVATTRAVAFLSRRGGVVSLVQGTRSCRLERGGGVLSYEKASTGPPSSSAFEGGIEETSVLELAAQQADFGAQGKMVVRLLSSDRARAGRRRRGGCEEKTCWKQVVCIPFVMKKDLCIRVLYTSSGCEEKASCGWITFFLFKSMAASGVSSTVGGYGAAFLTVGQQERFTSMKTKLCGNKAVDVADLEKNEADGSLTSTVKGTQIRITYELLESLFGVSTTGHSGVNTVDIQAKGLGIVGPEFKLKDGKIDSNHATFSTCTKSDSDMMFWAIQNQGINMAEVIIERMKLATAMIWNKKSKLNVSLPYAYLLTKIFQHFGINLTGEVSEKMGQAIRSRNLKKSGFSLEVQEEVAQAVAAAAGPAVLDQQEDVRAEMPAIQEEQAATAAAVRVDDLMVSDSRIEDISPEHIESVGKLSENATPTSVVASVLRSVLDSIPSTVPNVVALGNSVEFSMEEAPIQGEQKDLVEDVASGHIDDVQMEDAPSVVESTSDEENVDNVEPVARASEKGKNVVSEIPLLTRKPHQRLKQKKLKINMKPIIDRLDEQGKILCSVQSDIASIFISQSTSSKEMGMVRNAVRWVRSELSSIKDSIATLLDLLRAQSISAPPTPSPAVPSSSSGPSGPVDVEQSGPSGPKVVEEAVRPSGPIEAE
ncbi:hypothetical protein Taro_001627 [Colocasia esculenta]|uniref:Uncharacterized protein n=1 Tax=Colocasia esculenta TaxID=4460 RepID=A0A843TE72_COLES|nr:hypothetical protein [Colocasia esculenta]